MKRLIFLASAALVMTLTTTQAKLVVKVDEPKRTGEGFVLRLMLKNTFGEEIESARATLFLLDERGKPVEQMTRWVIGGEKERPALAPGASTTYNFVVTIDRPFVTTKLVFSRIVLEGGKLADPAKDFQLEK